MNTKKLLTSCLVLAMSMIALCALALLLGSHQVQAQPADDTAARGRPPATGGDVAWKLAAGQDSTTLVQVLFFDPATLDPTMLYDSASANVTRQIYEPLVTHHRERADELIPLLASGWNTSADGQTYTFNLRQGIHFHNGASLTPEDVAYTFWRGILTSDCSTAQWMVNEALFGVYDVTLLIAPDYSLVCDPEALQAQPPEVLQVACQTVKDAISYDDAAGTVTFQLVHAWSPFLDTIAGPWGGIVDKQWVTAQGAWNGSCSSWQNYYATPAAESPIAAVANGTGPFMLDYWTPAVEVALERNPDYWLGAPLWPGGPSGPAALERVLIKNIPDGVTRYQMLLNGEADMGYFSPYEAQLDPHVLLAYAEPDGRIGSLVYPTGTLKAYTGVLGSSATDAFFNFEIATGGPRNYIGSGTFDGNGIPFDFFSDIHVRKAFNYAFDWSQFIAEVQAGTGIQRTGPIIKGIMGYAEGQPHYSHNSGLALAEMAQAWGGQALSSGFAMTLTYTSGNTQHQAIAEIVKKGVEALDPGFQVNVMELPWSDYLFDFRNGRLPLAMAGWIQDIPHPHNWVQPYLVGTYGARQNLPGDMLAAYQAMIDACLALVGEAARTCYEDIQVATYEDAVDIFTAQDLTTEYVRAEVQGFYTNLAYWNGPTFYALSKSPLPTVETVLPGEDATNEFASNLGSKVELYVPAGSVSEAVTLVAAADVPLPDRAPGYVLGKLLFDIAAYDETGLLIADLEFNNPVTLTITYNDQALWLLDEATLQLFWWNGSGWEDAACGLIEHDPENNVLIVPICHLSEFALAGQAVASVMLPVIMSD